MKRTLAFVLAMVMILAALPFQVFAVELPFVEFDEQPKEVASYEWDETKTPPTCTATFGEEGKEPVATETATVLLTASTDATCTSGPTATYTATFTDTEHFKEQTKTVTSGTGLGHAWGEAAYSWSTDHATCTATRTCTRDASHVETEKATASSSVTENATCENPGKTEYIATFKNEAFEQQTAFDDTTPAALDHAWGTVTYTWADDYSACTATRTCTRDASHKDTETVNATSQVKQIAACDQPEITTYTATFQNEAFAAQTQDVKTADAPGHAWGEVSYTWADDHSTCTATRVCATNAEHVDTETVNATFQVTKTAACDQPEITTYTATFTNTAFATQTQDVETADAPGHTWGDVTYTWADDHSTCTATRTCANDPTHVDTETVKASSEETVPATTEAGGKTTYTATFTNTAFATQTEVVDTNPLRWGDANGDGKVNSKDIVRLKNYLANYDDATGTSTVKIFRGADANGDGAVNSKDIVRLKNYFANYNDSTGISTVILGPQQPT